MIKDEVAAIRAVLEKADAAGRTHMGIAQDLFKAGFRMVEVEVKADGK